VIFDVASGNTILPSGYCKDQTCLEHHLYYRERSVSAMDIDTEGGPMSPTDDVRDGANIVWDSMDAGEGEVTGPLVKDTVCLGKSGKDSSHCTKMGFITASEMSAVPFRDLPNDGIIGLGLAGLSIGSHFNFLQQLADGHAGLRSRFGIFLAADGSGAEIAFGGIDRRRLAEKLTWVPVTSPEQGYWQVNILEIRVGDQTLYDCRGGECKGIVDMGTSRLGVPDSLAPDLEVALAVPKAAPGAGLLVAGRNCRNPDLHLDLGGLILTLQAEDYAGPTCAPKLTPTKPQYPTNAGTFVLGEPLLKRYYTAFDWQMQSMGFGKAKGSLDNGHLLSDDDDVLATFKGPMSDDLQASQATRTIILLQVKFQRAKFVEDDDEDI